MSGYFCGHRADCPCYGCFLARGWFPSVEDCAKTERARPSHRDFNWVCFACQAPLTLNGQHWECPGDHGRSAAKAAS